MADELLAVARDRARTNRFWQHLGIEVAEVREGWARLRVDVRDELRNAPGAPMHGAVYAALVDAAVGCALATVNPESAGGVGQTTLDLNVSYLAAARGPTIFAEGTLLRRGRTVAFGATLPVIAAYIYLQKYMVEGLTAGGVKG